MYGLFKNMINRFKGFNQQAHDTFLKSARKVTFRDTLYYLMLKVINGCGTLPAGNCVAFDTSRQITPQALFSACKKIPANFISTICQNILKTHFFEVAGKKRRPRILLIDGTKISLSRKMTSYKNGEFPLTNKKTYRKGLLTFIYDVQQKVPICYNLVTHGDERKAFLELTKHLIPGDILIFDRGYYSQNMLKQLTEGGYKVLFRLSKSNKSLFSHSSKPPFESRTVSLSINDQDYTFLTNLPAIFTSESIRSLYHSRWEIEEFYKLYKMSIGVDLYNYKDEESLNRIIETQWLVSILIALIGKEGGKAREGFKRSPKYTLAYLKEIIYHLLYTQAGSLKRLTYIFEHIWRTCLTKIVDDRHFPRIAIVRRSRFYGLSKIS